MPSSLFRREAGLARGLDSSLSRRTFFQRTVAAFGTAWIARACLAETQPASPPPLPSCTVRILYEGPQMEPKPVDCSDDPYCAQVFRKSPLMDDALLVGKKNELRNVFVSVVKGLPKDYRCPQPDKPVVVDQKCWFIPRIFAVLAGQRLVFANNSRTLEVPHGYPERNKEFSFNVPEGQQRDITLEHPETFRVKCDVHPWELAWCHVMAHPFFALSDDKGAAALYGLPAGEYELRFWHERLEAQTAAVRIEPQRTTHIDDITLKPRRRRVRHEPQTQPDI
ncbi:MAG: hypothetical protein GXY55_16570 [Phycisphaerae bacterium]|nr:hypothetical protein [Phycisphaerae bacterium]